MPKTQRRPSIWDFYQGYSEHGMLLKTEQPVVITPFTSAVLLPERWYGHKFNLNQIAKRVNATSRIYAEDMEDMMRQQRELWTCANDILKKLASIA